MKPLIGITCNTKKLEAEGIFDIVSSYQGSFVEIVEKAGGIPVLLPILDKETLNEYLEKLDGMIITGGDDVEPALYHEDRKEYCGNSDQKRDEQDPMVIQYCIKHQKPILCICRGIQILNVSLGGTLYQDVYQETNTTMKHNQPHTIRIQPDSILYPIFQNEEIQINSFHHQGIKEVAKDLIVKGKAEDGIVECVEIRNHPFGLGMQWHPEWLIQDQQQRKIFEVFVEACKK